MTITYGPNLGLMANAADGEAHGNDMRKLLRGLDALVQCHVKDKDLATPPASPADGDCYIVAASPTGAWAGQAGKLARYSTVTSGWEFFTPKEGWRAGVEDENTDYRHDGSSWVISGSGGTFTGGTLSSAIDEIKGADIASAATTNIAAATGNFVTITGTTPISALGTVQAGARRVVRFAGSLTLTHNATSLILPGGANITTQADDTAVFISEGSGNWRCVSYQRADGSALTSGVSAALVKLTANQTTLTATVAAVSWSGAEYQIGGTWWSSGNPTRLTVPAGVTRVRIIAQATFVANATGVRGVALNKNGSYPFIANPRAFENTLTAAGYDHSIICQTGIIQVTPGDYFEVIVQQTSGSNLDVLGQSNALTWACIEAVR